MANKRKNNYLFLELAKYYLTLKKKGYGRLVMCLGRRTLEGGYVDRRLDYVSVLKGRANYPGRRFTSSPTFANKGAKFLYCSVCSQLSSSQWFTWSCSKITRWVLLNSSCTLLFNINECYCLATTQQGLSFRSSRVGQLEILWHQARHHH